MVAWSQTAWAPSACILVQVVLFSTCVTLGKSLNLLIHSYLVPRANKVAVFQHLGSAWCIVSTVDSYCTIVSERFIIIIITRENRNETNWRQDESDSEYIQKKAHLWGRNRDG